MPLEAWIPSPSENSPPTAALEQDQNPNSSNPNSDDSSLKPPSIESLSSQNIPDSQDPETNRPIDAVADTIARDKTEPAEMLSSFESEGDGEGTTKNQDADKGKGVERDENIDNAASSPASDESFPICRQTHVGNDQASPSSPLPNRTVPARERMPLDDSRSTPGFYRTPEESPSNSVRTTKSPPGFMKDLLHQQEPSLRAASPDPPTNPNSRSSSFAQASLIMGPGEPGDEDTYADPEWIYANPADLSPRSALKKKQADRDQKAKITNLALHKANFELRQELRSQKAYYEAQIEAVEALCRRRIALGAASPVPRPLDSLKSDNNPNAKFDGQGKQTKPLHDDLPNILRETAVDTMLMRAQVNMMCKDYATMQTHADNALQSCYKLRHEPTVARCHYYRGIALFHQRHFVEALDAFNRSFGCAGLYGIEAKHIEKWEHEVNEASSMPTPVTPNFKFTLTRPNSTVKKIVKIHRTDSMEGSTLIGTDDSPKASPDHATPPLAPHPRPSQLGPVPLDESDEEPSNSSTAPTRSSHRRNLSQGGTNAREVSPDSVPLNDAVYRQAIERRLIRGTARRQRRSDSGDEVDGLRTPREESKPGKGTVTFDSQEQAYSAPSSIAGSEGTMVGSTLIGSQTSSSYGSTRSRRPHLHPIDTSRSLVYAQPATQNYPSATPVLNSAGEMDEDEINSQFGSNMGVRSDASPPTPTTPRTPGIDSADDSDRSDVSGSFESERDWRELSHPNPGTQSEDAEVTGAADPTQSNTVQSDHKNLNQSAPPQSNTVQSDHKNLSQSLPPQSNTVESDHKQLSQSTPPQSDVPISDSLEQFAFSPPPEEDKEEPGIMSGNEKGPETEMSTPTPEVRIEDVNPIKNVESKERKAVLKGKKRLSRNRPSQSPVLSAGGLELIHLAAAVRTRPRRNTMPSPSGSPLKKI